MASTFKSNDTAISEILKDIASGAKQLPDFQRGWVWDDERICALITSIYSAYPVGALMFLEYGGALRFKYRPFTGAVATTVPSVLVLDGQQRLTSIFCAMFCKDAVQTQTAKKEHVKRLYYLDINKCLAALDDRTVDRLETVESFHAEKTVREGKTWKTVEVRRTREEEIESHMFPLNIVFDHIATMMWSNDYHKKHNYDKETMERFMRFNAEILVPIQSYTLPVITLNANTPKEAVCQVFENVNTGGVALSVFELVTATFAADDFELRDFWYGKDAKDLKGNAVHTPGCYERMVAKNPLLAAVSDVDFLVASTLLTRFQAKEADGDKAPAVSCKKQDVLDLELEDFKRNADALEEGFVQAAKFLTEQRIFIPRDLPYTTQFIPFATIFALLGQKTEDGTVRTKLARWYWCGVFGEMYGGANETRYVQDVTGVMRWLKGGDEPETINRAYFEPRRLLSLQTRTSAAYKGVMALILKAKALDFISGKEMDFVSFSGDNIDIHHIFPKSYCEKKNMDSRKWNSIVNKTPLAYRTNRVIGGDAPSVYLKRIVNANNVDAAALDTALSTHFINVADIRADNFDVYFVERAKSLLKLIGDAMGKPVTNLGGEDVVAAFGGTLE